MAPTYNMLDLQSKEPTKLSKGTAITFSSTSPHNTGSHKFLSNFISISLHHRPSTLPVLYMQAQPVLHRGLFCPICLGCPIPILQGLTQAPPPPESLHCQSRSASRAFSLYSTLWAFVHIHFGIFGVDPLVVTSNSPVH